MHVNVKLHSEWFTAKKAQDVMKIYSRTSLEPQKNTSGEFMLELRLWGWAYG